MSSPEAKIRHLDGAVTIQEQVLALQVAVRDVTAVAVLQALEGVRQQRPRPLLLFQARDKVAGTSERRCEGGGARRIKRHGARGMLCLVVYSCTRPTGSGPAFSYNGRVRKQAERWGNRCVRDEG